jgi:uncharacterized protein YdhG (YjbR/CyaY superfamily)
MSQSLYGAELSMAKADCKTVDEYIDAQPQAAQSVLAAARDAIPNAVPEAQEIISYNMP